MLEDAGAGALVTQAGLIDRLPEAAEHVPVVVRLDADGEAIAAAPASAPAVALDAHNLAYVIYTSGSTGMPKGVGVAHAGIPNLAAAQIERFAVERHSRVLQFASPSFDAAISEIATALLSGATLVVPSPERSGAARDGASLSHFLREQKI